MSPAAPKGFTMKNIIVAAALSLSGLALAEGPSAPAMPAKVTEKKADMKAAAAPAAAAVDAKVGEVKAAAAPAVDAKAGDMKAAGTAKIEEVKAGGAAKVEAVKEEGSKVMKKGENAVKIK
jgi:hypothetical protein